MPISLLLKNSRKLVFFNPIKESVAMHFLTNQRISINVFLYGIKESVNQASCQHVTLVTVFS